MLVACGLLISCGLIYRTPAASRRPRPPSEADGADALEKLPIEDLCRLPFAIPDRPAAAARGEPCASGEVPGSIPIESGRPLGGITYVNYQLTHDLDRVDFRVTFESFDRRQGFFLQLYQGVIGNAGFYFGILNLGAGQGRSLIFSRWFDDSEIAAVTGIDRIPACKDFAVKPYRNRVLIYGKFLAAHPESEQAFKDHLTDAVRINAAAGGHSQLATDEGAFAGVGVEPFEVRDGDVLTFSIAHTEDDDKGSWYAYMVRDDARHRHLWVGSLRFPSGALIKRTGGTWTELFAPLAQDPKRGDNCQYYADLPRQRFVIEPLRSYPQRYRVETSYGDNAVRVPQQDVRVDERGTVTIAVGPRVVREHPAGTYFVVPRPRRRGTRGALRPSIPIRPEASLAAASAATPP